jgi:hypothetical protein
MKTGINKQHAANKVGFLNIAYHKGTNETINLQNYSQQS